MRSIQLFCLIALFTPENVLASINDYIYPKSRPSYSNYGSIGLIQNPTARLLDEGHLAISWSHNEPYLRGSILAYPFSWMEASFQYTDVNDELYSEVKAFSGSQTLKDKAFDAKFRLFKESVFIPQVAVGLRDLGGTGRFASEYIVANKFISNSFDISFGIGWANLNANKISNPFTKLSGRFEKRTDSTDLGGKLNIDNFFSGSAGYFGGIEYFIPNSNGMRFKIEYDGTNYQTESNPQIQDSKFNFGFVYPITNNFQIKLSHTRGNTFNFGFSYSLNLGSKNPRKLVKEKRIELDNTEIIRKVTSRSDENLYKASLLYLNRQSISLQKASIVDDSYEVVVSQNKFRSPALAVGRVLRTLNDISPEKISKFKVSEVNAGMGIYSLEVDRESLTRYEKMNLPEVLGEQIRSNEFKFNSKNYLFNPTLKYPAIFHSIGPDLQSQIGGPDGFFFGDLKLRYDSETLFNRRLSLITTASYGLYDNMKPLKLRSDSILPRVRTDIVDYLKESREFSIKRMQLNFYGQPKKSLYYKLSAGIFESMFAGYGGEVLYRPYHKNFGIGFDAWQVYQREYNQLFEIREYKTITGHLNFYYHHPQSNILFHLKGGKYLAKDSGVTFDFSRVFRSGLRVGAYFTLTDISEEEFGEGSFDKGFYFWIPVDLFSPRYFKRTFGWGLRPVTRDGGQSLVYGYPLWGVTDAASNHRFRRRISDIFD